MTGEKARLSIEIQREIKCRDYTADYLADLVLREPKEDPGGRSRETSPTTSRVDERIADLESQLAWFDGLRSDNDAA